MQLENKIAIVTGGAAGIGAGIVERFLEVGAAVTIFDINGDGARELAERLRPKGRVMAIQGNVAVEDDARRAVEETVTEFGVLDILVNNAGILVAGKMSELTSEQWDRQLNVNLKSIFLMSKYAIRQMRGRGGAIVNISSVHAFVSFPENGGYDASKSGMLGLTRTMAMDHGAEGIRVNAICPGYIRTPLLDTWLNAQPDPAATMQETLKWHPLGRIGTPRDIADAAVFLSSDAAGFITGASLVVDGALICSGK
jgi:NAD(P)-dependent dehydrogenase (short-subunit alcohol dehydrogenase family)